MRVRQRFLISISFGNGLKRAIGSEGNLDSDDSRFGKDSALVVDVDEIGDPQADRVRQKRRKLFYVEVTGRFCGKSRSRIDSSGARTRSCSCRPKGLMKAWIVTSLGMS